MCKIVQSVCVTECPMGANCLLTLISAKTYDDSPEIVIKKDTALRAQFFILESTFMVFNGFYGFKTCKEYNSNYNFTTCIS